MSTDARLSPPPRARAVAEAPVDALLLRADELARRWAIALIVALPLERIGEIPLQSFAREAPAFCEQLLRALRSDAELDRISAPSPAAGAGESAAVARHLGPLAGARDGRAAVEAVEALRGVIWEALLDELRWPSLEQLPVRTVADLGDRLAHVCSRALAAALETPAMPAASFALPEPDLPISAARGRPGWGPPPSPDTRRHTPAAGDARSHAWTPRGPVPEPDAWAPAAGGPADAGARASGPGRRSDLGAGVVIIDEGASPLPGATPDASARVAARRGRPLPWEIPLSGDADERA